MPSAGMPAGGSKSRTRIVARILIVEDEARIASFLGRALTSCGFEVEWANDGDAALKKLTQVSYDLVLLDLLLPSVDGFSVLRELTAVGPDQQVLVLSALSDVESKVRCFELGASDYLTKPFSIAELVARVRARVQHESDRVDARFLEQGGLKLDLRRRVAISNGRPVNLSTREFLLLEYLMRKEGDVCTRQELLAAVWGYTFDPGTNVVDVYVRRLRSKVGREIIETIRNVGYCYAAAA
jgi:DNA-binding response OmpR family regulator